MYSRRRNVAPNPAFLPILILVSIGMLAIACSSTPAAAPPAATQAPAAAPTKAAAPAAPAATTQAPAAAPTGAPAPAAAPTLPPAVTVGPMTDVKPNKRYKMAFANYSESVSFSVEVRKGLQAAADKFGVDLSVLDNKQDVQQANTNLDNVLTQKPDFFFEYQADPQANVRISQKLKDANMKAIAIQVAMPDFPFYVVDNPLGGELGGKAIAEAGIKKFGKDNLKNMLMLTLPESGPAFISRFEGVKRGVRPLLPDIKITEQSTKSDAAVGRQITADFLTAHPNEKIIMWTHVDQMALAALSAVKAANRTDDVLIASLGGESVILPELRTPGSIIIGTVGFFPDRWGNDLIPLAIKWLNDGTVPPPVMNPPMAVITQQNVNDYYKP